MQKTKSTAFVFQRVFLILFHAQSSWLHDVLARNHAQLLQSCLTTEIHTPQRTSANHVKYVYWSVPMAQYGGRRSW